VCVGGLRAKLRPVIPGVCKGELLIVDRYISFFGEVDPVTGCLKNTTDLCVGGKVLVFRGSRGSTVAPYILYALRKNSKAPTCMLVKEVEPMLVAGCVLGEIPLYVVLNYHEVVEACRNMCAEVEGDELRVHKCT